MRRLLFRLAAAILWTALVLQIGLCAPNQAKKPAQSAKPTQLILSVPKGWKAGRTGTAGKTLIMMVGRPQPAASIVVMGTVQRGLKLDSWYKQNKTNLPKGAPSLKIISESNTKLAGQPARAIEFTSMARLSGEKRRTKQVYVVKNTSGYVVTFAASEDNFTLYSGDLKKVLAAARWTK
jgi:hypothetical protein